MIITEIVHGRIIHFPTDETRRDEGAELVFNGRVRSTENGELILALEYEHYSGMAEKELNGLAQETVEKFPLSDLFCRHRIGRINIGETSLHVAIWSKHRKEGLEAMTYFITELKKRVPIWKWAILQDGEKVPSECTH
jgi:molybdopterin synthase catalytic subunit